MTPLLRHFLPALFLCLMLVFPGHSVAQAPVPEDTVPSLDESRPPVFRVIGLDDRPSLRESIRMKAAKAYWRLRSQSAHEWEGTALIVWTDEERFMKETGFRPEHSAAAASSSRLTIWINERAWSRANELRQQEIMTHEAGHLLLGTLPGGKLLPLWANEGIVMHLAGQWDWDEHLRLLTAHAFGQLPQLQDLETKFPRTGDSQGLAYRMSYAAIGTMAQAHGDDPGSVRRLLQRLAHPERGPYFAQELHDPYIQEGWQRATERDLGSRFTTGVIVLTGSGALFLLAAVLVIVGYFRVKARNAARAKAQQEEEAWAESLTDKDVQDIYGDRQERWDDEEER